MENDWEKGRAYLTALVGGLRRTPWAALEQLLAYADLAPPPGLTRMKFGQWKDSRADGSLRIVVQQYQPGVVVGKMAAEGFVVYPDGRVTQVPQDEMWQYT